MTASWKPRLELMHEPAELILAGSCYLFVAQAARLGLVSTPITGEPPVLRVMQTFCVDCPELVVGLTCQRQWMLAFESPNSTGEFSYVRRRDQYS